MKDISVVIPLYNGSAFILETLQSIVSQTYPPTEIVIVDDCSSDNSRDLVGDFSANSHVPVRLIRLHKNSGGPAVPVNVGFSKTQTELVAICEQDDVMKPIKLQRCAEFFDQCDETTLLISRYELIGDLSISDIQDDSCSRFDEIDRKSLASDFYPLSLSRTDPLMLG